MGLTVFLAQDLPSIDAQMLGEVLVFDKVFWSVVSIIAAIIGARLWSGTLDRLGEQFAARRLLLKKVASLSRFGIYLTCTYIVIFGILAPRKESLLAFSAGLVFVLGLALKPLAESIIAGVIILIDSPFQVGDRVEFAGTYGEVTEIGLRVVRITTLDDNLVSIPNNKFLSEVVSSGNAGALDMMIVVDFFIGMDEDHLLAKRIVFEAAMTSRYAYLVKPVKVHVHEVSTEHAFATRIRAKLYVIDVRYETDLRTDITERVRPVFRKYGICPPYHDERTLGVLQANFRVPQLQGAEPEAVVIAAALAGVSESHEMQATAKDKAAPATQKNGLTPEG